MVIEKSLQFPWGGVASGLQFGDPNGPPVLLLHGWLDNAASFSPLIPHLPKGFQYFALDLAGHGLSGHRPKGTFYHLVDSIWDLIDVIDQLGWQKLHLIGHSLGGVLGATLGAVIPDRLESLMLIESLGPFSARVEELVPELSDFYKAFSVLPKKKLPVYPNVEAAAQARVELSDLSLELALILARRGTKPIEGGFTWRTDQRLLLPIPVRWTEAQLIELISHIQCPTLLIRANRGLLTHPVVLERITKVPSLKVIEVSGGHHVHMESPIEVSSAISDFLFKKA